MRKLKLYLDTSIWNFYFAADAPKEKAVTLRLIDEVKLGLHDIFISDVVTREISEAGEDKAKKLVDLINNVRPKELAFDKEALELADKYISEGIIPKKYEDDAFHIAVASVYELDAIISWNFKHIVKLKTKREVVGVNILMGYKEIDIFSPWEVVELERT